MPLHIKANCSSSKEIFPEDLAHFLLDQKIDVSDENSLAEAAPLLHSLSLNKHFLVKDMESAIKDMYNIQKKSIYNPQVHMLWTASEKKTPFSIRACFWPSSQDAILQATGTDPFFYHRAHDHNFNFLTVGYHGPGYGSHYYEYDYAAYQGYPGEHVDLRYVETSNLYEGKVLLYRAFLDVHNQLPPESFSVSINILETDLRAAVTNQYFFDVDKGLLIGEANSFSPSPLLNAFAILADEDGKAMLADVANRHRSERFRLAAWSALIDSASSPEAISHIIDSLPSQASNRITHWIDEKKLEHGL